MSDAQQDRLDCAMLQSMSASLSLDLDFSFNRQDMADLLFRVAERINPKLRPIDTRADLPPTLAAALTLPEISALVEAADHLLRNYMQDELDEPNLCCGDDHWSAILDLDTALAQIRGTS